VTHATEFVSKAGFERQKRPARAGGLDKDTVDDSDDATDPKAVACDGDEQIDDILRVGREKIDLLGAVASMTL
jgi:hypothetical protein